jgi:hypothetical protein
MSGLLSTKKEEAISLLYPFSCDDIHSDTADLKASGTCSIFQVPHRTNLP